MAFLFVLQKYIFLLQNKKNRKQNRQQKQKKILFQNLKIIMIKNRYKSNRFKKCSFLSQQTKK